MNFWKRIRQWRRRAQFEAGLEEEMRFHREMAGPAAFGSMALALEDSRAVWGFGWLESLIGDIRYALRGFRKSPGFTVAVIGTIGAALSFNATLFTVFNAYALRPFAVRNPWSLYEFSWYGKNGQGHRFTWEQYRSFAAREAPFSEVMATESLLGEVEGRTLFGQLVSGNYFTMLGGGVTAGRPILPRDGVTPGSGAVMVLGYDAWKDKFGGDPNLLGKTLHLRGHAFEVVGIANPGFAGLESLCSFWIPVTMHAAAVNGPDLLAVPQPEALRLTGRLQPGMPPATAKAALMAALTGARRPTAEIPVGVILQSRATSVPLTRDAIITFIPIFTAFGLVLLIACANVSNMMLARGLARQREIGIRISLGAGRARLVRQLLTESVLLALPAAALGFAVSESTVEGARRLLFATVPGAFARTLVRVFDPRLAGLRIYPAGVDPGHAVVRPGAGRPDYPLAPGGSQSRRLQQRLPSGPLAQRPAGDPGSRLLAVVDRHGHRAAQPAARYRPQRRPRPERRLGRQNRRKVSGHRGRTPGRHPRNRGRRGGVARPALRPRPRHRPDPFGQPRRSIHRLQPGFSGILHGLSYSCPARPRLHRQRSGSPSPGGRGQRKRRPPAVAGADAIGQTVSLPPRDPLATGVPSFSEARVIGVARDALSGYLANSADLQRSLIYFPTNRHASKNESSWCASAIPRAARRSIAAALDGIAPSLYDMLNPMDDVLAMQIYPFQVTFWVAAFLGGLALLMTISGIYGVLSYLVSQRTKEIGIRVALGASSGDVVRIVVRQSARLAVAGVSIGIALVLAIAPVFAHQIEAIHPYDALAYGGAAALVLLAAVAASLALSRRAGRADPMTALRCD